MAESKASRGRRPSTAHTPLRLPAFELNTVGLVDADEVRWRDPGRTNWSTGRVTGVGTDGSIAVTDSARKLRSLRPETLHVLRRSRRGALVWRPVITDSMQLALFVEPPRPKR